MEEVKKKWKHLRDRYVKVRKAARAKESGSAARQKSWKYLPIMGFLEPTTIKRETSSNSLPHPTSASIPTPNSRAPTPNPSTSISDLHITLDPDEDIIVLNLTEVPPEECEEAGPSNSSNLKNQSGMPPSNIDLPLPPSEQRGKKRKAQRKDDDVEKDVTELIRQGANPEELFLLSLAPQLRSLSEEQKTLVKIEFLQTLHRVKFS